MNNKYSKSQSGFTLVELIVAMAIAGLLMLGLSIFFSSTFRNMFVAQGQAENIERQFVVNEIIRKKMSTIDHLVIDKSEYILSFNKNSDYQLPFTYIGTTKVDKDGQGSKNYMAFKDLMIFNKMWSIEKDHFYANSGSGKLSQVDGSDVVSAPELLNNFSGFAKVGNVYYIALPLDNKIMACRGNSCSALNNIGHKLRSPTDIATDGKEYLFISDSENGRVIKLKNGKKTDDSPILTNLKYPTGLAYYDDGEGGILFVADTLNNRILKVNATNPGVAPIVAGGGDDTDCKNSTAKFCKLNMPTGLYADSQKHELYIADSGNNRILRIQDPGIPKSLIFQTNLNKYYALDKIEFKNNTWEGGKYNDDKSKLIGKGENHYNSTTKTFYNPNKLTVFENEKCVNQKNILYTNENPETVNVKKEAYLKFNKQPTEEAYMVGEVSKVDCKIDEKDGSLPKWKIVGQGEVDVDNGDILYLSHPKDINVQIDLDTNTKISSGFQTFEIQIYDIAGTKIDPTYYSVRVGDNIVGTMEDTIDVVAEGTSIQFPTGVTNNYFVNLDTQGNAKIHKINFEKKDAGQQLQNIKIKTIDIKGITVFDHISNFVLKTLKFDKYNGDKILELLIQAQTDANNFKTYKLNAVLSK